MKQTISFFLQNRYNADYNDALLNTISSIPGTGASGGLVASLISNFDKV